MDVCAGIIPRVWCQWVFGIRAAGDVFLRAYLWGTEPGLPQRGAEDKAALVQGQEKGKAQGMG